MFGGAPFARPAALASHDAMKRRAAQANENLKLGERIAESGKVDCLRLDETQGESRTSAKPTCGARFRVANLPTATSMLLSYVRASARVRWQPVNVPSLLRAIESSHRAVLTHAFGQLQPEPGWAPPDLDILFLCFTNRCGSNYLAHLLASTGAFNEAGEFFNAPVVLMHAAPRGLRSLPQYFSALPALVPHSGRIAAKASIDQLTMLVDTGILDALRGRATYLLIERQDRLAQAISRVIAWQNGRWTTAHASDVPDSALVFDRATIDLELAMIDYENAAFSLFFSVNGIVPIHITYEALLADAGPAVGAVAATMGLTGLCPRPEKIAIYRQANAINAAWRATYIANSSFAGTIPNADKLLLRDDSAAYAQAALKDLLKIVATLKNAAK